MPERHSLGKEAGLLDGILEYSGPDFLKMIDSRKKSIESKIDGKKSIID